MNSSLLSGVSGLEVHQQMLDVIGNNLANINTTGFKSQASDFADLVYQTFQAGTSTSPVQVGLGAQVADVTSNFTQGGLQTAAGTFNMAIQGNGFFVVSQPDGENLYTRNGSFAIDANDYLVDPATGFHVQRFGSTGEATPTSPAFQTPGDSGIKIPYNTAIPGQATTTITLQGNLSAAATGPMQEVLTSAAPFLSGGQAATANTLLNSLDNRGPDYPQAGQSNDTIQITGTDANGATISTSINANSGTTVGDLLTAINGAFMASTATLDGSGNLVLTAKNAGPANMSLTLTDSNTTGDSSNFPLHKLDVTVTGKNGDTVPASIQVYDSQGTAHALTLTFQKVGGNDWDLTASLPSSDGTMLTSQVTGIQFNDNGSFRGVTGGGGLPEIKFQVNGLSGPQVVDFALGGTNGFDGLTQFGGASTAAAIKQDGFAAGYLTSVSTGPGGEVQGVFSNGSTLPLAQMALATFSNEDGLQRVGENYYTITAQSGVPQLGAGLTGGRGSIQEGSLESSNVDVALEFTRLITAQRGYEVNAKTITVSDQMLQTLSNVIQ